MSILIKLLRIFRIFALIAVVIFIVINIYVYHLGSLYIIPSVEKAPHARAAIILGAAVTRSGDASPVLRDRVEAAVLLYTEGKVDKILMSGSNPTQEYNEVSPVRDMLIEAKIPSEDVILDYAGFDTYSSMYRATEVFKIKSAIVVTQSFHLPRALYLARSFGIDAYGISADKGSYLAKNYFRELGARPKAFFEVVTNRVPRFSDD
ncbi:MAG: hypothetical protein EXS50_02315 [Candidatus Taylorbacteria bacterium]|nr:hypothetical protein [Candidatus Taylorbacteria bacterium]